MAQHKFYQLGGHQPQLLWFEGYGSYETSDTLRAIFSMDSPLRSKSNPTGAIELILGIMNHGSSHLLLSEQQMEEFVTMKRLPRPRQRPFITRDFESLSPISFAQPKDLADKLSTLKPKYKGKGKNSMKNDTSQANKVYHPSDRNEYRGAFEHGRLIYKILNENIDPTVYGVDEVDWTSNLHVLSFVFTSHIDQRKESDRIRKPSILDVGFCEAHLPSLSPNSASAKHFINQGNAILGARRPKKPFLHGTSEGLDYVTMTNRISDIFKDYKREAERPTILLVYNAEITMNFLSGIGVHIASWHMDIKDLLASRNMGSDLARRISSSTDYNRNYRDHRDDRRSISPRRREPGHISSRVRDYSPKRENSAYKRSQYPPIYVLDIQKLYTKLMCTESPSSVLDIAPTFSTTKIDGYCAGNEAVLILDIWKSMISGPPIDEQRILLSKRLVPSLSPSQTPNQQGSSSSRQPNNDNSDDDSECDPNDMPSQPQGIVTSQRDHYNFDESDYESASD